MLLLALLCAPAVEAEVYRCDHNGQPVYTDRPCAAGAAPATLPSINGMSPQPAASDLARDYDERRATESKEHREADAAWLQEHEARKAREDLIRSAMVQGRIIKGMRPEQVQRVLHSPTRIEGAGSESERWIYESGGEQRSIGFKDGVVSTDASRKARTKK